MKGFRDRAGFRADAVVLYCALGTDGTIHDSRYCETLDEAKAAVEDFRRPAGAIFGVTGDRVLLLVASYTREFGWHERPVEIAQFAATGGTP